MKKLFMAPLLWLREIIPKLMPDLLAIGGSALIVRGIAFVYVPAAWIAAGAFLLGGAVIWSKGGGAG